MADQKENTGFVLPIPGTGQQPDKPTAQGEQKPGSNEYLAPTSDTSTRDMAVGVVVMLVLLVAFFFARGAYANWLVGRKVSPRSANAAGWWLFIFLVCLAAAGVFPLVAGATFMSVIFLGPILAVALAALVMMLLSSRG